MFRPVENFLTQTNKVIVIPGIYVVCRNRHVAIQSLSRKERVMLEALSKGSTNRELSKELGISTNTVKFHLSNLYDKLSVRNRAQAIAFYYSSRLPRDENKS